MASIISEPVILTCNLCESGEIDEESVKYCVDCAQHLCSSCLTQHNKFPVMKAHTIRDWVASIDEVENQDDAERSSPKAEMTEYMPTVQCEDHPGLIVDMFCRTHTEVCCSECIKINHSTCGGVEYIPTICNTLKKSNFYDQAFDALIQMETDLKTFLDRKEHMRGSVESRKADIIAHIEHIRQNIDQHLNKLQDQLLSKLDNGCGRYLEEVVTEISRLESEIRIIRASLERLENANNYANIFVHIGQDKATHIETRNLLNRLEEQNSDIQVSFQPHKGIDDWVKQLKTFGTITVKDETAKEPNKLIPTEPNRRNGPPVQSKQRCVKKIRHQQLRTDSVSLMSSLFGLTDVLLQPQMSIKTERQMVLPKEDIHVRLKKETQVCNINGACYLPSGDILLTDGKNCCVKRVDKSSNITGSLNLSGVPMQICIIDKNVCAVAISDKNYVQFVCYKASMSLRSLFPVGKGCIGIAREGTAIFVSCGDLKGKNKIRGCVEMYTLDGTYIRVIGDPFLAPNQIATNISGSGLYVVDADLGGVVVLEKKIKALIECAKVRQARGVCSIAPGKILVCGYGSNNVILCEKGESSIEVLTSKDGIRKPQMLCFDKANNRLFVGLARQDVIKMYHLNL